MKTKDNLMICTITELAKFLANSISIQDIPDSRCPNVDFSIIDVCDINDDINKLYDNASGWHGIKVIDTGFDSCWLDTVAAYYGGANAVFKQFSPDDTKEEVEKKFKEMILEVLGYQEIAKENTFLIVELIDKMTFEEFWETGEVVSYCSGGECPICDDILAELNETPFYELKDDEEMYEHARQLYEFYLAK